MPPPEKLAVCAVVFVQWLWSNNIWVSPLPDVNKPEDSDDDILPQETALLDVVVVGAGPAGSHAAYRLARQGYSTAVLEKRPAAGFKTCCTGIISQECMSRFDIPSDLVYHQVRSVRLFSPSGNMLKIARSEAQACVINRSAFDVCLAGLAQDQGAQYLFNTIVEDVEIQSDKAVLSCQSKNRTYELEAKAVILACGFNPSLVKKAGFGQCRYITTGAQVEVQSGGLDEIEVFFGNRIAPGFFAWLVPTQHGRALAGLISRHAAGLHLRNWLTDLAGQGKIKSGNPKITYCGIPMYPLPRTYKERLLVIGDAAGQVKPTTGGGIYFGLLCADIAAATLHRGLKSGDLSAGFLADYQTEWHKILRGELRSEYLARRLYQSLSDASINKIFILAGSNGFMDKIMAKNQAAFDWHGKTLSRTIKSGLLTMVSGTLSRLRGNKSAGKSVIK
jgi:digeranylgeranylglycerophospholipid reductase